MSILLLFQCAWPHREISQISVREYLIVDPDMQSVHVNILKNHAYIGSVYEGDKVVLVQILPDCSIDLCEVFVPALDENDKAAEQSLLRRFG